jgi:hypothetical protein
MFVRNGEALGSVQVAEPKATAEPQELESEPEASPELEEPKEYDSKPEWVEFAVSKGADRDEVSELTKKEIIDLYGSGE